jgi:hypothetical protein
MLIMGAKEFKGKAILEHVKSGLRLIHSTRILISRCGDFYSFTANI